MQQPYGNYPYYPMYNQTPYMGANPPPLSNSGYPPFYGPPTSQPPPAPHNNNPPAPAPYSFDAAAYNLKATPTTTVPFPKQHRRHQTAAVAPAAPPLKSAMKKTMKVFNTAEATLGRQFSNPFHNPAANSNPNTNPAMQMPRPRAYSNPTTPQNLMRDDLYETEPQEPVAYHMMVSFHGYNELRIEHVMKKALDDLRNLIWPLWKDGIETDIVLNNTCIVKFKNNPWDMGGPNIRQAYKLITAFFRLFQDKGYSFQTAVNISTPTPRLIFQVTQPDPRAHFFIAYFDHEGTRFTLIEPPNHIDISIGARLRSALPHKILSDQPMDEYARVIEIRKKPNSNVSEVEPSVLFVEILKILNNLGFQLDASLAFGRRGTLGMRSPRELLVFKGYLPV